MAKYSGHVIEMEEIQEFRWFLTLASFVLQTLIFMDYFKESSKVPYKKCCESHTYVVHWESALDDDDHNNPARNCQPWMTSNHATVKNTQHTEIYSFLCIAVDCGDGVY